MVNAMGKTINSVALELKAAELNKTEATSTMLLPMKQASKKLAP
jgi:hypothetical protein